MRRKSFLPSLLILSLLYPVSGRGADMKAALSTVPSEAIAVLCIPSIKDADTAYQRLIKNMELDQMLPPMALSVSTMLRGGIQLGEGMDEDGSFAVIIMPAQNVMELMFKMALLVPASQPRALLENLNAQPGEEDVWTVNLFGQPSFAVAGENRVVFARMPDVAKAIVASKEGLDKKLSAEQLRSLQGLHVALWLNADQMLKLAKPQIDAFLGMMAMMQAGGPLAAKQVELNKKQIETLTEGLASFSMGLALQEGGVNLRFAMTSKPGTDLYRQSKVRTTTESLLTGLPAERYMVAFGQTADPEQMKAAMSSVDDLFALAAEAEGVNRELLNKLKAVVEEWVASVTAMRGAVQTQSPGEHGVLTASAIIEAKDARKFVSELGEAVRLGKEILTDEKLKAVGEEGRTVAAAISFEPDAEDIAGVGIAHLKFDLSKIEDIDEDDLEDVEKVIGSEGLLFRVAPIGERTVGIAFGGGTPHMGRFIELARKNESPLDADAGIRKLSAQMSKDRNMVMYVAVDRLLDGVRNAMMATGDEPFPVRMPPLNAPLAVNGTGKEGWSQVDVLIPTELIVAGKNAVMEMMGVGAEPPEGP